MATPLSLPTSSYVSSYTTTARKQLIADLRSTDADTRDAAVKSLSNLGRYLSPEQVEQLEVMMRTDGHVVKTTSWRGPHCTHYERTSAKYYAGRVLETLNSPYVTKDVKSEAILAQSSGVTHQRDDDPGWI